MADFKAEDYFDRATRRINESLRRNIEVIDLSLALVLVALSIVSLLSYQFYKGAVTLEIQAYGFAGLFLASAFLEFVPQILNPFLVILVGIASGLNPDMSILVVGFGSIFGSVLGFELGRIYGIRLVSPLFSRKTMNKVSDFWAEHGKIVVLVSAITPLPYVPLIFGSLNLKRKHMWIYGLLPRILSFAIVGYGYYFGLFQYNL